MGSDNTIGGTTPAASNIISANGRQFGFGYDVDILATGNLVEGNLIGTNAAGAESAGDYGGVDIEASGSTIGGTTSGAGNLISGNSYYGILIGASDNLVEGNRIGTDATGTLALYNKDGIMISSPGNTIGGTTSGAGNLISGNEEGVLIIGSGNTGNLVEGNLVGTDPTGTSAVGNGMGVDIEASGSTIGGTTSGAGNLISGNSGSGIYISGSGNLVEGNRIGTNPDGTASVSNGYGNGVEIGGTLQGVNNTIGGTTVGAGNLVSGNANGIVLYAPANLIEGNLIGTDVTGNGPLANSGDGLLLSSYASSNTIGGTTTGAGNTIAFNNPAAFTFYSGGVVLYDATAIGNSIRGNSIHDNGGLGIDLGIYPGGDGVTLNGSHAGQAGPNDWQTYPILTSVTSSGGSTTVGGTFSSTPNTTYALDFYASTAADPTGFGEGQTYIGTITVTTDGNGNATFTATLSVSVPTGQYVSATATNLAAGDTSEFSPSVGVNTGQVPVAVNLSTVGTDLQNAVSAFQSVAPSTTPPLPSVILAVDPSTLSSVAFAISGLTADTSASANPVPIVLNLAPGTYSDTVISAPAGVAVTINGGGGAVIVGNSPALEVESGNVLIENLKLTTATDSPTIVVTGGNLTVRDSTVQGTPTYTQPAILITGGTLDLGTATNPGDNTINVNPTAEPVHNATSGVVSDFGDTYQVNGTPLPSPDLSFTTLGSSAVSSAYGQSVTLTAAVRAANPTDGTPTGSVDFVDTTTGADLGAVPISGGVAQLTTAALDAGAHAITARYLGDSTFAFSLDALTQTVNPQTAVSATYTGLLYVATASATTSTATVTLSATIKDLSGGAGTITNATVTFINEADGSTIASNLPVSLISSTDPTTGTASYNWSVNIGTASSQSYTIGIIVGGDYARNSSADDAVVTVSRPQAGSATGGGYLVNRNTAGLVPGDAGAHTNFGFNARNNSGGVQGQANIIVRYQGHVYQFQSTSITSLTFPSGNTADYAATGTVQDVTDSSSPVTLYRGASLQVTLTDNGSSSSDTIGITILTPGGALWFSSDWNGTSTVEQGLGGGNLQVRPAQELAGAPATSTASVAPLTLDEIQPVVAEAVALWGAAGIDAQQLTILSHAMYRIDDLGGSGLAWERQGVITLDRTADGYGWFIGSAPGNGSVFAPGAINSPASGHVDLLSVVAHEMGHLLGYGEDDSNGVTGEYLPLGVRRVPVAIPAAGQAPGPLFAASTAVGSPSSVFLGTTTASEPLMALDAALAGWSSSHHESGPQQDQVPVTVRSVLTREETGTLVPRIQVWPRKPIIDSGPADAVTGSGSISSLLGDDVAKSPTRKGRAAVSSIPSWAHRSS